MEYFVATMKVIYWNESYHFYILVTKEKPFQVRIYKVQKSEKEVFKKKQCWQLSDLKLVVGKEDTNVSKIQIF